MSSTNNASSSSSSYPHHPRDVNLHDVFLNNFTRYQPAKYSTRISNAANPDTRDRALLLYAVRDRLEANILQGKNDSPYLEGTGRLLKNSAIIKDHVWDAQQELIKIEDIVKQHADETVRVLDVLGKALSKLERKFDRTLHAQKDIDRLGAWYLEGHEQGAQLARQDWMTWDDQHYEPGRRWRERAEAEKLDEAWRGESEPEEREAEEEKPSAPEAPVDVIHNVKVDPELEEAAEKILKQIVEDLGVPKPPSPTATIDFNNITIGDKPCKHIKNSFRYTPYPAPVATPGHRSDTPIQDPRPNAPTPHAQTKRLHRVKKVVVVPAITHSGKGKARSTRTDTPHPSPHQSDAENSAHSEPIPRPRNFPEYWRIQDRPYRLLQARGNVCENPDRPCRQCGGKGHWAVHCEKYECFSCHLKRPGHCTRDCPMCIDYTCKFCKVHSPGHFQHACPVAARRTAELLRQQHDDDNEAMDNYDDCDMNYEAM